MILPKFFIRRNRPVRCKSRWRKVLDKRYREADIRGEVVDVERRRPFMTVRYFPKTEEEKAEVERRNLIMMLGMGVAVGPAFLADPGRFEKMLEECNK